MHYCPEFGWMLEYNEDDPPDLCDGDCQVGVEVTRAVLEEDAQLADAYARYCSKNRDEIPKGLLKKISKGSSRGLVFEGETVIGAYSVYGSGPDEIVVDAVIKKTDRLNRKDYPSYKTDAIFVYNSGRILFEKSIKDIFDSLRLRIPHDCRRFHYLFIYCDHELYICNLLDETVTTRKVTDSFIEETKETVLMKIGRAAECEKKMSFLKEKQ